jgi:hypothetical protein
MEIAATHRSVVNIDFIVSYFRWMKNSGISGF